VADYETHSHDVLVVGAGGAGLRAAIEAAASGARVGLICKSLLGKAHTVMAEGGVAAALANVDDRDNWQVHFADTMRGGQYMNNWRMAELHAKEAPDRVRELEAWGAVFDRTPDGRILQRNFGGHKYPRLAHVGDRTGLEFRELRRALDADGEEPGDLLADAQAFFIGVADVPLTDPYDFGRLERKADAGADFVQTQIVYDVDAFGRWAEEARTRGILERMFVMAGGPHR